MCFKQSLPAASVKGPQGSRTFLDYIRMCSDPPSSFFIENAEKFPQNEETPRREVVLHESSLKSLIPQNEPISSATTLHPHQSYLNCKMETKFYP